MIQMDPIQVAIDYCNEMDLQYTTGPGPDREWVEVHHFRAGARVHKDGKVESALNGTLKTVLERKIKEARLQERPAQQDEASQIYIKFSSIYEKMPDLSPATKLLAVFKVREEELSTDFLVYDTKFLGQEEFFPLEHSDFKLVLLLLTEEVPKPRIWTTARTWEREKEAWYRSHVGEYVNIQAGRRARPGRD